MKIDITQWAAALRREGERIVSDMMRRQRPIKISEKCVADLKRAAENARRASQKMGVLGLAIKQMNEHLYYRNILSRYYWFTLGGYYFRLYRPAQYLRGEIELPLPRAVLRHRIKLQPRFSPPIPMPGLKKLFDADEELRAGASFS